LSPLWEYTPENIIYPLNIEGEVNAFARLELYPRVDVKFYGFFGPYAEIVPFVEGNYNAALQSQITLQGNETFLAWNSGINLGLDLRVGTELSFLALFKKEFFSKTIPCFNTPLWKSPVNIELLTELPAEVEPGATIELQLKVTDYFDLPVALCPVYFSGDGEFSKQIPVTDVNGKVIIDWVAGETGGEKAFTATIYKADKSVINTISGISIVKDLLNFNQIGIGDIIEFEDRMSHTKLNSTHNGDNEIPNGTILLFKTNEGRYGKMLIISNESYFMYFFFVTYNSDGSIYNQEENAQVRDTYTFDLDNGSSPGNDFWWEWIEFNYGGQPGDPIYLAPTGGIFIIYSLGGESTYIAKYSSSGITVDGQISESEWSGANKYDIIYVRYDGFNTKQGQFYLQHDNTWLYVGAKTYIDNGWNVYLSLKLDGNNDDILNGSSTEPHTDINMQQAAPGGWSGHSRYDYLGFNTTNPTTAPTGTQKASNGATNVSYEFKIKLSDLSINSAKEIGFYMFNYNHGVVEESYVFPSSQADSQTPSGWAHIKLE